MKLLLGCGGDPSRCDLDGISAFDYAVREQQWEVYEYLHNVVNETDDSIGSQCAYTLDLGKLISIKFVVYNFFFKFLKFLKFLKFHNINHIYNLQSTIIFACYYILQRFILL